MDYLQPGDYAYYVNGQFVHVDLVTETIITETPDNEVSPPGINTDVKYKLSALGDIEISDDVVALDMDELMTKLVDNIIYDTPILQSPPLPLSPEPIPNFTPGRLDTVDTMQATTDFYTLARNVTEPGCYLRGGYLHVDIIDGLFFEYTNKREFSPAELSKAGQYKLSQMEVVVPAIYVYADLTSLRNYLTANIVYDATP